MNYKVSYKKKNDFFWKNLSKVKGDLVATDLGTPMRVFILEDETRVEIPLEGTEFKFSAERFLAIKQKMEQEAGQQIPIKMS
jgi:hypothetical protein